MLLNICIGSLELVFKLNVHILLVINVLVHKIGFMKACRQYYSLEFEICQKLPPRSGITGLCSLYLPI